jgi:1-acyl-sn-glycerol-3-phosphate acyltransferase
LAVANIATLQVVVAILGWLLWAWLCAMLMRRQPRTVPRLQEAPLVAFAYAFCRVYARVVHRLRVTGAELVPARGERPVIVVANHTAGVDPMLLQAACPFEITWMMGRDMMMPGLAPIWNLLRLIPVEREGAGKAGRDSTALRKAVRALRDGQSVGIFPEGHIPLHGELGEFSPGVGMLIHLARGGDGEMPVLVARISGTPKADRAWKSLLRMSNSRVEFLEVMRFDRGTSPEVIATTLRERIGRG